MRLTNFLKDGGSEKIRSKTLAIGNVGSKLLLVQNVVCHCCDSNN